MVCDEFKPNVESSVSGTTLYTYLSNTRGKSLIFSNLALLLLGLGAPLSFSLFFDAKVKK